jgi:hypothetical protein
MGRHCWNFQGGPTIAIPPAYFVDGSVDRRDEPLSNESCGSTRLAAGLRHDRTASGINVGRPLTMVSHEPEPLSETTCLRVPTISDVYIGQMAK